MIVVHVGGVYEGARASCERFVRHVDRLSHGARRRVALENDDRHFGIDDLLWIHRRTGIRLVFDTLHHRCHNPTGVPVLEALQAALATWPGEQQPKVHFSSPRTAIREVYRDGRRQLQVPLPNQHSDFIHPFEFIDFLNARRGAAGARRSTSCWRPRARTWRCCACASTSPATCAGPGRLGSLMQLCRDGDLDAKAQRRRGPQRKDGTPL